MQRASQKLGPSVLVAELERRLKANSRYSLRAFARDLDLSPGQLSELLSGKRTLTVKAGMKLARRLGLSASETQALIGAAALEASGLDAPIAEPKELSLDTFEIVSEWHYFAILNLFETRDFRAEAAWIARRLGIPTTEAKLALERLERVGLLKRSAGKLVLDSGFVFSPTGIPAEGIRSYHRQILDKAKTALETQLVAERDITGLSLALDPRDLPALVQELRALRDRVLAKYARGKRTEVYHLEMALFRLTEKGTHS